jgi:hypothetical protein
MNCLLVLQAVETAPSEDGTGKLFRTEKIFDLKVAAWFPISSPP